MTAWYLGMTPGYITPGTLQDMTVESHYIAPSVSVGFIIRQLDTSMHLLISVQKRPESGIGVLMTLSVLALAAEYWGVAEAEVLKWAKELR